QTPSAFMTCGDTHGDTHAPPCSTVPRGQTQVSGVAPCTIGGGHTHLPSRFRICGGGHFGTQSPSFSTVPRGHSHGPGTNGDGQICGTQVLPCCTVPVGHTHEPGMGPGTIGGGHNCRVPVGLPDGVGDGVG